MLFRANQMPPVLTASNHAPKMSQPSIPPNPNPVLANFITQDVDLRIGKIFNHN